VKMKSDRVTSKLVVNIAARRAIVPARESRASAMSAGRERDEDQAIVESLLARETPSEKRGRALRCSHGKCRSLCWKCAGLTSSEIQKWDKHRTKGRRINRGTLNRYIPVKISRADCVLVSRPKSGVSSPDVSNSSEFVVALFFDPNSRFQKGGTGYLRIPLDAARSTRADSPAWIHVRESFLRTLRPTRAARGEKILSEFYLEDKTDAQIAEIVGWTKDALKKERKHLIKNGDEFFQPRPAGYPLAPL
jgi:hypothetical protein